MGRNKHTQNKSLSDGPVETITTKLRAAPCNNPCCFIVLFGNRPLSAPMQGDESILVFSSEGLAKNFISGYTSYYHCEQPLSVLALCSIADLWAILHARSLDSRYKLPVGMTIDFSYSSGTFQHYGVSQLEKMGQEGLARGLTALFGG